MLKESYFPWNQTLVTCPILVLFWNCPITTGDGTTDKLRLPSLDISRRDQSKTKHRSKKRRRRRSSSTSSSSRSISSDSRKKSRRSKRSKHSHKERKRRYTSSFSSSSSDSQLHDYGRYKRTRHSPQAVQNTNILQPAEIINVQTILPEQTLQHPSKDSGSDSEIETWSFDKAINEVFRLLPPELCHPRSILRQSLYLA